MIFRRGLPAFLLLLCAPVCTGVEPVLFKSVDATHCTSRKDLENVTDGIRSNPRGWSVAPDISKEQAAVFQTASPVNAYTFTVTLYFLSGHRGNNIAEFALSVTNDAEPSLQGHWEPVNVLRFIAGNATLEKTGNDHLRAQELPQRLELQEGDAYYQLAVRSPFAAVTGFRLAVFPVTRTMAGQPGVVVSWGPTGDFVLTEFRVEPVATTNVAIGAVVKASHALYTGLRADALTDGKFSTFAHPAEPGLGAAFYFEIDLGALHALDHIGLRARNELGMNTQDRFSRMLVQLFDREPADGVDPVWQGLDRADGSHPNAGEVDVLSEADGKGVFRGRYIRISSDSAVPYSPQLAEVEVFETRTPEVVSALADDRELALSPLTVPTGTRRLSLVLNIPQFGMPPNQVLRWRLKGYEDRWSLSDKLSLDLLTPPAGRYTFEAQASHNDLRWDATILSVPMTINPPFVQTWTFRWLAAAGTLGAGGLISLYFSRRRMAALEAQNALASERERIARNMHDVVGARLSQLAMLHDVFARKHALPEKAGKDLRVLSQTTQQTMESLDEVVWTVNPQNDTLESMAEYLAHYASTYLEPTGIACRIQMPIEWPEIEVRAESRHEVVCAFKEALHNVVKHARASEVQVSARMDDGQFEVHVADNGCGLLEQLAEPGCDGMKNMKSRLAQLRGNCEYARRSAGGTEVTMRVPMPR